MKKRIISFLLSAAVALTNVAFADSINQTELNFEESERVTLIVEVEGDALLADGYASSYAMTNRQAEITEAHSKVMAELNADVDGEAEPGFVYTALFNGFSIETDSSNIEEIKAIEGVKDVYIAGEAYLVEPYLQNSSNMISAPYSYDLDYSGEGMVVAIIDAGCDTGHDFFAQAPASPKYSKTKMAELISSVTLNSGVKNINTVYKNEKIPYAYNYRTKTGDTYLSGQNHGTHVSGIVGGKNGLMPDGTTFSGIAPEAQLLILSCGSATGVFADTAIVAAINDAALLGADVINMSFGVDYYDTKRTFSYKNLLQKARDAGIMVMSAAGNSARGFYEEIPKATNIDYSSSGIPAGHGAVTAVASAMNENNLKNPADRRISEFSSWGVDGELQLKPEITAPGGSIYSSINGDKYRALSGTSMAAPHMSGVAALAMQYYKSNPFLDEYNNMTAKDKVNLIENIMMNSADIIRDENGIAQSPRVQGAGLVNIENMLKSRVLITGDSGKAKLSLGDKVTNVLDINFSITNISKETVTFDSISAEIMTDGYAKSGDEYLVDKTVKLDIVSDTMPDTITIEAGQSYDFVGTISLDEAALENNKKIFTNGFYIDGFIILQGESAKASLPLMGFYGNWGAAPIFDSTVYSKDGSTCLIPNYEDISGTYLSMDITSVGKVIMGKNIWFGDICDERYIAFPSGTATLGITTTNHRSMENYKYSIKNSAGKVIYSSTVNSGIVNKYAYKEYTFSKVNTRSLEEGDYSVNVSGNVVGDADITHNLSIPFYVDKTPPDIFGAKYDGANKSVSVSAKDNHYLQVIFVQYLGADGKTKTKYEKIADAEYARGEEQTVSLDVSDIEDEESLIVGAFDYATNGTYYAIDYLEDKVGAALAGLSRGEGTTSIAFNVRNNMAEEVSKKFVVAFYNNDNILVALDYKDVKLAMGEEKKINYPMLEDTREATYAKLFIWDWNKLLPYDQAKQFVLE